MSVIRVHHNKNYTCMSNHHFQDKSLSLKAKGLLSLMLSLPDTWDYSIAGLASLSSDGETSVRTAIKELEEHYYLNRTPVRENGRIVDWEYDIFEKPQDLLDVENQQLDNALLETKDNKVNKQLNKKEVNTNSSKELLQNFPFGNQKPKKENLYSKCVSLIDLKTGDLKIRQLLIDWLNMLLEKYRNTGRVLYANVFKGKLNMLDKFDERDWRSIIEFSIQRGYEGFYPVTGTSSDIKNKPWEQGVTCEAYTKEELEAEQKDIQARLKRGERVYF